MNKATLLAEIRRLSPDERLELIEEVYETLPPNAEDFELTGEQIEELERRLAEHRANPDSAVSWDEIRADLRSRLR